MERANTWLVDVDGTLVDNGAARSEALLHAIDNDGRRWGDDRPPRSRFVDALAAAGADPSIGRDRFAELSQRERRAYEQACRRGLPAMPGAGELLRWLRTRGTRIIALSPGNRSETTMTLAAAGLLECVDEVLEFSLGFDLAGGLERSLRALERAAATARSTLLLGKSPDHVRFAKRAGFPVVTLLCGGHPEATLAEATAIYQDPQHLLGVLRGSWIDAQLESGAGSGVGSIP